MSKSMLTAGSLIRASQGSPAMEARSVIRLTLFYVLLTGTLCALQDQWIYHRAGESVGDWTFVETEDWVSEISFSSEDGTELSGWYGTTDGHSSRGTVLYFHGNAENVATQRHELTNICRSLHYNCLVVDYRGFGRSRGAPSEAGILMDARAAMRMLNELSGTRPADVIVYGRSLGGAPAAHVASELGAKCLVLHSTYAAMDDLVAGKLWFAPMHWLLWNHLRTIEWVRAYRGPTFIAHGKRDNLIPFAHAERLYAASTSSHKVFLPQPDASHFDAANREFYLALHRFLSTVSETPDP
ncbi:MAG: alpha/beta hydrolase [Planctomycetales bacterium]|nr:alpha/beta hydrolase [Planctomycetales bacterium]